MKMKKMILLMLLFCLGITASMNAQVKIGEGDLAPGAVLDLTNTENLGLLLPQVSALPESGVLCKLGMMVFYNNRVYTYNGSAWLAGAAVTDVSTAIASNAETKFILTTNLKTVNGESLIGTGNVTIVGDTGPDGPQGPTGPTGPVGPTPDPVSYSAPGILTIADYNKLRALLGD
jgi:hypothetical protein